MPVIVREYSDVESVVIMVDSNIQRDNILPSEKAFAYKMKLEALKHQGVKSETGSDAETADLVGKEAGDSGRKVQRYIRLTELLPELLELVDRGKIKVSPAVSLSYLSKEEQEAVESMRKGLNGLRQEEAVDNILNMFSRTKNNEELIQMVKKTKFI